MNKIFNFLQKNSNLLSGQELIKPENPGWSKSLSYNKIVFANTCVNNIDLNKAVILGGICCLKKTSFEEMKQLNINNSEEFSIWYKSWYPRFDQLHDMVGIPPKQCKKIVYIIEDSFHAKRISYIIKNSSPVEINHIIKDTHIHQGVPIIKRYLTFMGYTGEIKYIFLSDILDEIKTGIKIAKRHGFRKNEEEKEVLKFLYTSFYPSIIGESNCIVFEPIKYISRYTVHYNSVLDGLPMVGFIPYISNTGSGSINHRESIHKDNYNELIIPPNNWNIINFLYMKNNELNFEEKISNYTYLKDYIQNMVSKIYGTSY